MAALPPEVRELFEGANFAHLATLMPDGSPHSRSPSPTVLLKVILESGLLHEPETIGAAARDHGVGGFKASGGIRTAQEAAEYLELADALFGSDWATPATFRFGASSLLAALLR